MTEKTPYGYGLAFLTLFSLYIRKLNLRRWTLAFWALGLAVMLLLSYVKGPASSAGLTTPFDYSMFTLMCFFWGCPGFLIAYRKGAFARGAVDPGKGGFVYGLIIMLLCWGLAVYNFYLEVRLLFGIL